MNTIFQSKRRQAVESSSLGAAEQRNGAFATQKAAVSDSEQEWLYKLHEKLLDIMDLSLVSSLPERDARAQIRDTAHRVMSEESVPLSAVVRQRMAVQLENEILGLGPLETLMADASVADILVNGYKSVYVERHGKLERTDVRFRDNQHLMNIIDRIVSNVGRRIDESSPMVDARLQDGSRVNVIIPPLALDGPVLSIRRFAVERLGVDDLVANQDIFN